jgi:hypothetical protein
VWGADASNGGWLDDVGGVTGHAPITPGARLVWCEPLRWFCPPAGFMDRPPDLGTHGGPRTRAQVAIAAGGHPDAIALAAALNSRDQIDATAWAPTIASLLSIERNEFSSAIGSSLLPNT